MDDLRLLEKDEGLSRFVDGANRPTVCIERAQMGAGLAAGSENLGCEASASAGRYLSSHDPERRSEGSHGVHTRMTMTLWWPEEGQRSDMRVRAVEVHAGLVQATLDMDATLIETHKKEAKFCYNKYRAWLRTYWSEADLIVHGVS